VELAAELIEGRGLGLALRPHAEDATQQSLRMAAE